MNHTCCGTRWFGGRLLLSSDNIHSRRFYFSKHATKSTFLALLGFPPGLTAGPRWLQNTEHLVAEATPPCALLLQHHHLPWEWMEPPSLNFTCKERTPGCPSPIRVPSPASQWGCTDFMLLQARMAGKRQGNCMRGRFPTDGGDSFQGHKTTSFSKMLAHMVDVSFHVSLGISFLEEKALNRRHWMPGPAVHSANGPCIFVS